MRRRSARFFAFLAAVAVVVGLGAPPAWANGEPTPTPPPSNEPQLPDFDEFNDMRKTVQDRLRNRPRATLREYEQITREVAGEKTQGVVERVQRAVTDLYRAAAAALAGF